MSLIRRRMLMAKKPSGGGGTYDDIFGEIPPESTEFGWPLYITVPYSFREDHWHIYERSANDIGRQLYDWMQENNEVEIGNFVNTYYSYPPELYINGELITSVSWDEVMGDFSDPVFLTSLINEGAIRSDGSIYIMIYYENLH